MSLSISVSHEFFDIVERSYRGFCLLLSCFFINFVNCFVKRLVMVANGTLYLIRLDLSARVRTSLGGLGHSVIFAALSVHGTFVKIETATFTALGCLSRSTLRFVL